LCFVELRDELALIEESLEDFPDFLPCLKELAAMPKELSSALRRWSGPVGGLEAALAQRTLDEIFRGDRALTKFSAARRERQVRELEATYEQWHVANAATVRETIRHRFLENVRLASLPHAQLTEAQKEFKTLYNRGRRELEHEFGKTMRYRSIRDLV